MTIPVTSVQFSDIEAEFDGSHPISLSEYYRGGSRVVTGQPNAGYGLIATSGAISVGPFRNQTGASNFVRNITANRTDYNLKADALASGWDGVTPLIAVVTVSSGVYLYASDTSVYAFATGTGFPSGSSLKLINNGTIMGRGGEGGHGRNRTNDESASARNGAAGGPALRAQVAITIDNNATIGGGGGGGGGGAGDNNRLSGSGAGGGRPLGVGNNNGSSAGGSANQGNNGTDATLTAVGQGGAAKSYTESTGTTGDGDSTETRTYTNGYGGDGGNLGAAGQAGGSSASAPGASPAGGITIAVGGTAGAAGAAIVGNSFITWQSTGTRLGAIT